MFAALALAAPCTAPALAAAPAGLDQGIAKRAAACLACHGDQSRSTADGYFPRIAGKPAGYLYNQLIAFRQDQRRYPQMNYMVAHLSDDYLRELAGYFSTLRAPYPAPPTQSVSGAVLERGRKLALQGDPARKIPACVACHGQALTGVQPAVPGLVGLPRDYLNAQIGAWKNGARKAAAPDCMGAISRQLSVEEIGAVSSWLAARPMPVDSAPAPAGATRPPLVCGSIPN
ncbi:MAG: cytochrome c4 [Massilia sp.]